MVQIVIRIVAIIDGLKDSIRNIRIEIDELYNRTAVDANISLADLEARVSALEAKI